MHTFKHWNLYSHINISYLMTAQLVVFLCPTYLRKIFFAPIQPKSEKKFSVVQSYSPDIQVAASKS
ncbi:hypothetical protein BJ165DRAFT_1426934, partial [Panaeolus papilionaceus]